MEVALVVPGAVLLAFVVAERLIWLAPTRLGWIFYLANILGEIAPKRIGLTRTVAETALAVIGLLLVGLGSMNLLATALVALMLLLLLVAVWSSERKILREGWTRLDRIGLRPNAKEKAHGLAEGFPPPSTHPRLTVTLRGPFVSRSPEYSLGTLGVGRSFSLEVIVGDHALTPTQTSVRIDLALPAGIHAKGASSVTLPPLMPGQIHRACFELTVQAPSGKCAVVVRVAWGDSLWRETIRVETALEEVGPIRSATVSRYPGASRAAFCWRGDMDVYDTSTLQSIEGLENALGLGARYRIPQTMYLSTRLSLDETEAREWAGHYGINRGAVDITKFVEWMRSRVELTYRADYPCESQRPYLLELGNHGHLHFGCSTSACEENNWNPAARFGAGAYPWLTEQAGSFEEQRDNALEARRWDEKLFGFTPRSWAMPDRTRDQNTPAAMEAAGCEVLSDSDVRTRDNVLFQPRPHFALGTGAVELTKRYPGDPQHILHMWMNLFWIHRAHRLGIPVVFMCHQHMRLFDGWACTRFTEAILRRVLDGFRGDLWVNTVYGVGVYWRDVLSERRTVTCELTAAGVRVHNGSTLSYHAIPVDLALAGGGKTTILVDLEPGQEVLVDARGVR